MSALRDLVAEELSTAGRSARRGYGRGDRGASTATAAARFCSTDRACGEQQLEGLMLDFYLIVSDYRAAYDKRWLAAANRLIPPNVFYFEHDGLAAKYAVLSEADFASVLFGAGDRTSRSGRASPSRRGWSGQADDAAAREGGRGGEPRRPDLACGD